MGDERGEEDGKQIQLILISDGSTYNIKELILKMCTLDAVQCVKNKSKVVFKIDHFKKDKLIVFFESASGVLNEIGYTIVDVLPTCTAENLLAKNSSEALNESEKAALVEVIHKYGKLYRASYPSASVTGLSDDSCPEVPKTVVTTRISDKTVAIFSSTFKSKICYAFVVAEVEKKGFPTKQVLIVISAAVLFIALCVSLYFNVKFYKKNDQESNPAPPSPQGENPMSVARSQNHQSNDGHNGANRPAVEVQVDPEDNGPAQINEYEIEIEPVRSENDPGSVQNEYKGPGLQESRLDDHLYS